MENEETGDRRQFQAAASNLQNVHPRPAEAGHPRQRGTNHLMSPFGGGGGWETQNISRIYLPNILIILLKYYRRRI